MCCQFKILSIQKREKKEQDKRIKKLPPFVIKYNVNFPQQRAAGEPRTPLQGLLQDACQAFAPTKAIMETLLISIFSALFSFCRSDISHYFPTKLEFWFLHYPCLQFQVSWHRRNKILYLLSIWTRSYLFSTTNLWLACLYIKLLQLTQLFLKAFKPNNDYHFQRLATWQVAIRKLIQGLKGVLSASSWLLWVPRIQLLFRSSHMDFQFLPADWRRPAGTLVLIEHCLNKGLWLRYWWVVSLQSPSWQFPSLLRTETHEKGGENSWERWNSWTRSTEDLLLSFPPAPSTMLKVWD